MKLRHRVTLLAVLMATVPVAVVILLTGREIGHRFQERDDALVASRMRSALADLDLRDRNLAVVLDALADAMRADNRLRLALSGIGPGERSYLTDYAPRQASLMRLDLLWILDREGELVSAAPLSGARGLAMARLPGLLAHAGGKALVEARSADGSCLCLTRTRPLTLGAHALDLVGGTKLDRALLEGWRQRSGLDAAVVWPGGAVAATDRFEQLCRRLKDQERIVYHLQRSGAVVHRQALTAVTADTLATAWLIIASDRTDARRFIASLRTMLWVLMILAAAGAAGLAVWMTRRLTRPLSELAARTATVDLDRLDVDFGSDRRDEVGDLARLLGDMTRRLRQSVVNLRAAEQRATLGEVARQVNHDIRNGIAPLRHVLRHLRQTADEDPEALPRIFAERWPHLEEGLGYLQELADRYARLTPSASLRPCHLDRAAQDVVRDLQPDSAAGAVVLDNRVPGTLPPVMADPVALRRIFTNLVRNALESLPPEGGRVTIDGTVGEDPDLEEPRLLISVSDNGCGIAPEDRARIFEDFFTTRESGTGLGLSNVRRLVGDLGGRITVQSEPGRGSTFIISLPLADGEGSVS